MTARNEDTEKLYRYIMEVLEEADRGTIPVKLRVNPNDKRVRDRIYWLVIRKPGGDRFTRGRVLKAITKVMSVLEQDAQRLRNTMHK